MFVIPRLLGLMQWLVKFKCLGDALWMTFLSFADYTFWTPFGSLLGAFWMPFGCLFEPGTPMGAILRNIYKFVEFV